MESKNPQKKGIYVVDDDRDLLNVYRIILEASGYKVSLFSRGDMMLQNLNLLPDLFLLDLHLPVIGGVELCKKLKADKRSHDIPVLIVSADHHVQQNAADACADDFIEKPFDVHNLRRKIGKLIAAGANEARTVEEERKSDI